MANALPDLTARVRLDTSDLDAGVKRATGIGAAVGSAFGGLASGAIQGAFSAVRGFATGSVDAFAAVEDATGAAGVQFGKALPTVLSFADKAASSFGLSKRAALDAQNTFGTLGKAAGLAGPDLAGFSGKLTGLAGDLASFKGTSTEQAVEAVGAALRGESEPIRAYGVLLDDATLRQEALALGLIKTTKDALTPQQKVLAAQSSILKQTSDAQGDYARTSTSTANTQKTLAAETENAQAALGAKLAPAVTALRGGFLDLIKAASGVIDAIGRLLDKVTPTIKAFADGLAPGVDKAKAALQALADKIPQRVLEALGVVVGVVAAAIVVQTAATAAASLVTGAWGVVTGLFTVTKNAEGAVIARGTIARLAHNIATVAGTVATAAWAVATTVFSVAMTAAGVAIRFATGPVGLIILGIAALTAGLVLAYRNSETFRTVVNGAFTAVQTVIGNVVGFAIQTFRALLTVWLTVAGGILEGAAKAFSWVPGVGPKLQAANAAFGVYKDKALGTLDTLADKAFGLGEQAPKNTAAGINAKAGVATRAAGGLADDVNGQLRAVGSKAFTSGANAGQGLVEGLNSYAGRVAAAAQRLAIIAGKAMSSGLQERSPSKVTRRIGAFAGEGLALGMDDEAARVGRAAQRLALAALPDLSAGVGASSVGALRGSPGRAGVAAVQGATYELTVNGADLSRDPGGTIVTALRRMELLTP